MSGLKHTPGPWDTDTGGDVTRTDGTTLLTREKPMDCTLDESFANATLAAAAPVMLEALRPLAALDLTADDFDQRPDDHPIYARNKSNITVGDVRRAAAAIARATGGDA